MLDTNAPNALTIAEFRARNGRMAVGTFYNLKAAGHIKVTRLFGKALVLIEDEQAFLDKLRAGEFAVEGSPCPKRRAAAPKGQVKIKKPRLGTIDPLARHRETM
jgi:hypothetical protein